MYYASILLHVEDTVHRRALTDVALKQCDTSGAFLTALHIYIPGYEEYAVPRGYPVAPTPDSIQRAEARARQLDATLQDNFSEQASRRGATRTEWRFHKGKFGETHLAPTLALHAQCADLVIMGQHDGRDRGSQTGYDTPAAVSLASGRPTLVLPHTGTHATVGQRIVLAWNATKEATRIASAALPLMTQAESVEIVVVNERKVRPLAHGETPGADIALFLARHGVNATVRAIDRNGLTVAETLLSAVAESGADLLCMGAYGHSRLRELSFGGVTFDLMRYMTVPTLIAC